MGALAHMLSATDCSRCGKIVVCPSASPVLIDLGIDGRLLVTSLLNLATPSETMLAESDSGPLTSALADITSGTPMTALINFGRSLQTFAREILLCARAEAWCKDVSTSVASSSEQETSSCNKGRMSDLSVVISSSVAGRIPESWAPNDERGVPASLATESTCITDCSNGKRVVSFNT